MMATLRDMPFPFATMASVSLDCDSGMSWQHQFGRFMRTSETTSLGAGLGLDVGESFWYFDSAHEMAPTIFRGDCYGHYATELTPYDTWAWPYWGNIPPEWTTPITISSPTIPGQEIVKYIKCGWIDSLHSFGDFEVIPSSKPQYGVGGRSAWEAAMAHFDTLGLSRFVNYWIDHHPYIDLNPAMYTNYQDAYSTWTRMRSGFGADNLATAWYHTDLTCRRDGMMFGWSDEYFDGWREADELNGWWMCDYVNPSDLPNSTGINTRVTQDSMVYPATLRDGRKYWAFDRWFPIFSPGYNIGVDGTLINNERLDAIVAERGFFCWYSHFGFYDDQQYYDWMSEAVAAFQRLKARQDAGDILITRTSRQLMYSLVRDHLVWEQDASGDIRINYVEDECFGDFVPSVDQLRGLTWYVDDSSTVNVYIDGIPVGESELDRNPADETTEQSIGIKWFEPDTTDYTALTYAQVDAIFGSTPTPEFPAPVIDYLFTAQVVESMPLAFSEAGEAADGLFMKVPFPLNFIEAGWSLDELRRQTAPWLYNGVEADRVIFNGIMISDWIFN